MDRPERPTNLKPGVYRFDHFCRDRIYGPDGYYENGNGVGVDFNTYANQDTPLARRLGEWLDEKWFAQGAPEQFNVYEIAAGDGTLCRKLLALDLVCSNALQYVAVESNPLYANSFPDGVAVSAVLPVGPLNGVMFANELLDSQPPRFICHRNGEWQELFVVVADKASYKWQLLDEPIPATLQKIKGMDGSAPWVQDAANLLHRLTGDFTGDVLMIDYGFRHTSDFPGKPWFRCWHRNKLVPCLDLSILSDMSALLPIDQIEELFCPAKVTEQATWLAGKKQPWDGFYVMEWQFNNGKLK